MIFLNGHGRSAVPDYGIEMYGRRSVMRQSAACGFTTEAYPDAPAFGPFAYLFGDVPDMSHSPETTGALDALADAMVDRVSPPENDSSIPPVFTYLGQFIDHDVTANTDRETGLSVIDAPQVDPVARDRVTRGLGNLRAGALNLDSLYGGGPVQGDFARRMTEALRFPRDRAKLWAGTVVDLGLGHVPLPANKDTDLARDVLRAGRVIGQPDSPFSENEILALPPDLRRLFVNEDDSIRVQRAILGDMRNDENLIVSQLHLGFVRFHNRVVDAAGAHNGPVQDREALFQWARAEVKAIYQWIVVNEFLPAVCDPEIVAQVVADGAPLYGRFLKEHPAPRPDLMPVPLEFAVAAFRFGHSMVRASYDWSRFFGRAVAGVDNFADRASFRQLFEFTGGAEPPMPVPGLGPQPRLPSHWAPEWDRLVGSVSDDLPDRSARRIDTALALPLDDLINEEEGTQRVLKKLARRNLRRGHRLNLPAAQDCIAAVQRRTGRTIEPLTEDELTAGATGAALVRGGFVERTPLWFYVLKEAEVQGRDHRLGPLGSLLVAETLAGLVIHDQHSYWHRPGSDGGRFHPRDGVMPSGEPVTDIAALLRAALLL